MLILVLPSLNRPLWLPSSRLWVDYFLVMTPASVLFRFLWHLANPSSGVESKAAAGEIFKCQVSESGGLPVNADGGALRLHA